MNTVCDNVSEQSDAFVAEASRRVLESSEW
jgi:hypothetical protein